MKISRLSVLKQMKSYTKSVKGSIAALFIISALTIPVTLISPRFFQILIDEVMEQRDMSKFTVVVLGLLLVYLLRFLLDGASLFFGNRVLNRFTYNLRKDVLQKYQKVPYSFLEKKEVGDLKMRIMEDVDCLGNFIREQVVDYFFGFFMIIFTLYAALRIDVKMTLYCLLVIPVLFLVIIAIAFFFLFDGLLHSVQTKQKMDVLQKQLEQEQEYYRILLRKHQQFQQLRHDMRDDFNYIAGLIKSDAYVTALEYAQRKSGQLALTSVIQTGNPMLDAILTIKEEQARRIHANFQSYISVELNQSKMAIEDLSSLCSNVLNNALEAVEQIEDKAFRRIFFRLVQKGHFLYIVVQNATSNEIIIEGDVLETTKQDKKMHGFGLSIVKNIVEKYDGGCHLEWEQYIFTVKIVLPVMEDEEQ